MTENQSWAVDALTKVLTANLKEQKRARRWKSFTRLLTLLLFLVIFSSLFKVSIGNNDFIKNDTHKSHTALISIKGEIAEDAFYGSAEHVIESLRKAFKQENVKGIILDLNSPGGSPVQSDLIYNEIKILQKEDKQQRKIYAVVSDICASGCYYLAAAADKIYANEISTVGSLGVLYNGFGFVDLIQKIGVDRRLQTAGKYKAILDPFMQETEDSKRIIKNILDDVHQTFIARVKEGRGKKINLNNPDLFSGLFWTGKQALSLGLVDDFKNKFEVAKEIIKAEEIVDYTSKPTIGEVMFGNISRVSDSKLTMLEKLFLKSDYSNLKI